MQRKIISLTAFFSFILLCITSIALYVMPEGRVAYWSNWTLLYLSKPQWGAIHMVGGFLFFLTSLWHIVLNWKSITNYITTRAVKTLKMPAPLLAALGICLLIYGGTLLDMPPMKQIVALNAEIKVWQAKKHGRPPYGHAELSTIEKFCDFMGFDLDVALTELQANFKGSITPQTTLLELAKANNSTPQQIFLIIKRADDEAKKDQ
jgi:hypothetical protein